MASITVVGAGVVGITTALALQKQGFSVTVLDSKGVAQEASAGNAGALAFADIEPLAAPGIITKAPGWLVDPVGPLSIPLGYAPRIAPWMLRFWRASLPDRHRRGIAAQATFMHHAREAFHRLAKDQNLEDHLRHDGQLHLYDTAADFHAAQSMWNRRRLHGVAFELLESHAAIAEIQPGLAPTFRYAGFTPQWTNLVDPNEWVLALAQRFVSGGGRIEQATVSGVYDGGAVIDINGQERRKTDHLVICAGAWSHRLARDLGDHIPLETERGYNTTLPDGAFDLRTHLTFGKHGFVVSKIGAGVRVGGAVELAGLRRKPNYRRAKALLDKAKRFLPGLSVENGTEWMGFRPSLPDSLPVIGKAPKAPRVIYAFGHGHLGLTQSAGTAELVAQLVTGADTAVNIQPFRPTRFTDFLKGLR
ncbi:MAG: NAD(P)/FAD-dependent oxidoreductase [Pelagimonas sp.]|uniref:NAD(P)/FAD-dependent oxidoreductase n=1 Tax=Pelagimonas sp. TaxID=2073170 RepID=UPI003D6B4041